MADTATKPAGGDVALSFAAATEDLWESLLLTAQEQWLNPDEVVTALRRCNANDVGDGSELLLLKEVTVPSLPNPGALYIFDSNELPNWREDGYSYAEELSTAEAVLTKGRQR